MAQGLRHHLDAWQSTCLAVQLHALAGDQLLVNGMGPVGMTASELAKQIRTVINAQLA
jgi:NAD(P)H-hydrate repair Nnr-like enzyme with NAD(P)H-hydrate dehydratase domain